MSKKAILILITILLLVIAGYLGLRWKIKAECSKSPGKEITKECGQLLNVERRIKNFIGLREGTNIVNPTPVSPPSNETK